MSAERQAPGAERRRHLKVEEGVSETARALIVAGYESGRTYPAIAAEVLAQTGEKIGRSSIQRGYRFWKAQARAKEAEEAAGKLIAEFKDRPSVDVEAALKNMASATIYQGLAEAEGEVVPPSVLLREERQRRKLDLDRQKFDLDRERQRIQEDKLALDRERLALEREKKLAIDRPALFLEFFREMVEALVQVDPAAATVLNTHFDRLMARVRGASA